MAEYISFQPSDFFSTKIYTGTSATNAQTFPETTAMQPDFVWIKTRDAGARSHVLTDSVRGVNYQVASNTNLVETNYTDMLASFDSDGFTLGNDATKGEVNNSGDLYASWNWKAGTTSGITTDGSTTITPSSYSFNQTTGISILKYTGNGTSGAKLAHGLGVIPETMWIHCLDPNADWAVYHHKMNLTTPQDYYMQLNDTPSATNSTMWNDTAPDSVNFSLGSASNNNQDTKSYIAYCFAEKNGFSRFGTYEGNNASGTGDADGTFVYTGFRPAFFMVKNAETTDNWMMQNGKVLGYNAKNWQFQTNTDAAETESNHIDFLSNGFKVRSSHSGIGSGHRFVYWAFAEFPLVSSNDIPGLAR